MSALIFDIETVGENFDELDETTKENLTHWAKRTASSDDEFKVSLEDIKNGMGLSPLTGEIVAIGVLDYAKDEGAVYYQAPGKKIDETREDGIKFEQMGEKEMLEKFWKLAEKYDEFVSFNGRGFDVPFLVARSAVHRVRPSKDLMSNRYLSSQKYGALHIDLQDQLTFYGSVRKKGSLHLWSRAMGIKSPKADGVTGDDVSRLFKEKKYLEIAKYNVGDIRATRELYKIWNEFYKL
jgi:hypothetical protein